MVHHHDITKFIFFSEGKIKLVVSSLVLKIRIWDYARWLRWFWCWGGSDWFDLVMINVKNTKIKSMNIEIGTKIRGLSSTLDGKNTIHRRERSRRRDDHDEKSGFLRWQFLHFPKDANCTTKFFPKPPQLFMNDTQL